MPCGTDDESVVVDTLLAGGADTSAGWIPLSWVLTERRILPHYDTVNKNVYQRGSGSRVLARDCESVVFKVRLNVNFIGAIITVAVP